MVCTNSSNEYCCELGPVVEQCPLFYYVLNTINTYTASVEVRNVAVQLRFTHVCNVERFFSSFTWKSWSFLLKLLEYDVWNDIESFILFLVDFDNY